MAIPSTQQIILPLLECTSDGNIYSVKQCVLLLRKRFKLTGKEFSELQPSGIQTKFEKRVGWARYYLGKAGLLESKERGKFSITPKGQRLLERKPKTLQLSRL